MTRRTKSRCRKVSLRPPQPGTKNRGGRPRGSFKRFPFNQTPIGFMLYNEAPAVYNILMLLCPHSQRRFPHPQTVALVCTASDDPALRKPKFRRYMKRYEREGCYCRRGKLLTPERERYYARPAAYIAGSLHRGSLGANRTHAEHGRNNTRKHHCRNPALGKRRYPRLRQEFEIIHKKLNIRYLHFQNKTYNFAVRFLERKRVQFDGSPPLRGA